MTEDCDIKDDDYLVRVKAQVMTRDDSTGGWVPMGCGGMSIVGLRKLVISAGDELHHEYLIHGQKIGDQSVVLNCVLKKDVQYTKANPTFHHWKTEEKKFGLTFQSSADARAFEKGVKRAIEDLLDGSPDSHDLEVGEDDVFMTLDLPLGRKDSSSQSASTASTTTNSPSPQSPALSSMHGSDPFHNGQFDHLHRVHYIPRNHRQQTSPQISNSGSSKEDIWVKAEKNGKAERLKPDQGSSPMDDSVEIVDCSYVQFAKNKPGSGNDYSYPTLEPVTKPPQRTESISSLKKHGTSMTGTAITMEPSAAQPPLPRKMKKHKKTLKKDKALLLQQPRRCVYCNEMFIESQNPHGSCVDAPDRAKDCIERVSCICCARGMLYHCMADVDGDYGHLCVCDNDESNWKKWTALAILSFFVPCLWCYWPLTACHRCGVSSDCCGGQHKATRPGGDGNP